MMKTFYYNSPDQLPAVDTGEIARFLRSVRNDDLMLMQLVLHGSTYEEMGRKIGKAPTTVQYRIQTMMEKGLIAQKERDEPTPPGKRRKAQARSLVLTALGAAYLSKGTGFKIPINTMLATDDGEVVTNGASRVRG